MTAKIVTELKCTKKGDLMAVGFKAVNKTLGKRAKELSKLSDVRVAIVGDALI